MDNINFRIRIPASTSNIGPGFDTLGLALSWYNVFVVKKGQQRVKYLNTLDEKIPPEDDLFLNAYIHTCEKLKVRPPGIDARIKNQIPTGAGFGSSAVAIIGGVLSAFLLAGKKFKKEEILDIAVEMEGHPDNITPSLLGGFTVSSVVNGKVFYRRFPIGNDFKAVIVIPDFKLKTRVARRVLPRKLNLEDAIFNINRTAFIVSSFAKKDLETIQWAFYDRVHQPTRSKLVPGLMEIIESANTAGAIGTFLSGAGPSVVSLTIRNEKKIAKNIQEIWKGLGIKSKIIIRGIDNTGTEIFPHS